MTLILELTTDIEAGLKARAEAQGIIAEQYAQQVLSRDLEIDADEPFWKVFAGPMQSLPDEAFKDLPTDGATKVDHYLYGSPKRDS